VLANGKPVAGLQTIKIGGDVIVQVTAADTHTLPACLPACMHDTCLFTDASPVARV
jgi:hypothetical protein